MRLFCTIQTFFSDSIKPFTGEYHPTDKVEHKPQNKKAMNKSFFKTITLVAIGVVAFVAFAPTDANAQRRPYVRDRAEDVRDRREDRRDHAEDIRDRREDVRDRQEDIRDARHNGGLRDRLEDIRDRQEDIRDRQEDVRDRREDVRDRAEDRWDRTHGVPPRPRARVR